MGYLRRPGLRGATPGSCVPTSEVRARWRTRLSGSGANGGTDFRIRQRMSTTVRLPGYGGAATDTAAVVSFIQGRNTGAETGSATAQSPPGGGFVGGAACAAAANPLSVTPEVTASSADAVTDEAAAAESADKDTLRTAPGEGAYDDNLQKLNKEELARMVQAALERLGQSGMSPEDLARLQAVSFEVADLPTGQISTGDSALIKIDETAAGYGWYFDQFPMEDSEFGVLVPDKELQTFDLSPAHGQMDLLTVVMRELGHAYQQGKDRISRNMRKNLQPLMEGSLSPGVRRLPLDQLRLTVPPTTGSIKPSMDDSLMAHSSTIRQPAATQTQVESTDANAQSNGSKIPAEARYAVFNPRADLIPGDYGRSAKPVSYAASARRVAFVNPFSGETINLGPFTIPPGEKIVIMFNATVNAANTFPPGTTQICNQGSVSATGIPAFLTDDPDAAGSNNPTCTALNVADVSVTKIAGSSPVCSTSNITFTINYSNARACRRP